jgi:hypothetical protein
LIDGSVQPCIHCCHLDDRRGHRFALPSDEASF